MAVQGTNNEAQAGIYSSQNIEETMNWRGNLKVKATGIDMIDEGEETFKDAQYHNHFYYMGDFLSFIFKLTK